MDLNKKRKIIAMSYFDFADPCSRSWWAFPEKIFVPLCKGYQFLFKLIPWIISGFFHIPPWNCQYFYCTPWKFPRGKLFRKKVYETFWLFLTFLWLFSKLYEIFLSDLPFGNFHDILNRCATVFFLEKPNRLEWKWKKLTKYGNSIGISILQYLCLKSTLGKFIIIWYSNASKKQNSSVRAYSSYS